MNIDLNDIFLINNIPNKNYSQYGKFQKKLDIIDIKHIFVFTYNSYLFEVNTRINNEITIQRISEKYFLKTLKNMTVGFDTKSIISLMTIFETGSGIIVVKNSFLICDASFYSRYANVLPLFQRYFLD
jgi:hypothetical protein